MTATTHDVFISYRRDSGADTARLICEKLKQRGFKVFLDVDDLRPGHFDEALVERIKDARYFLIILSKGSLERCTRSEDWLRREIACALANKKVVIPILMPGFVFPEEAQLPEELWPIRVHHGVNYSHEFFDAMMDKIASYLGQPGGGAISGSVSGSGALPGAIPGPGVGPIVVVDSSGTRNRLMKYGIIYRPFASNTLANAFVDGIVLERGKAGQTVLWELIAEVAILSRESATVRFRDGKTMEGVKLRSGTLIGTDEFGLSLSLNIHDLRAIEVCDAPVVVVAQTVAAGMDEQQVLAAWGKPDKITDERPQKVDNCLWDYGVNGHLGVDYRVQFASGKVKRILVVKGRPGNPSWVESCSR